MKLPSLDKLKRLEEERLITVNVQDDLILCNYTNRCVYDMKWDEATEACRGLILRVDKPWPESTKVKEIVALPIKKFFFPGEGGRFPSGKLVSVTAKIDGFLAIAYRDCGIWYASTRRQFDSEHAKWATKFIQQKARNSELDKLPQQYTLLFEGVSPQFRIVVDYGQREDLVLIACRNRFTGEDYPNYFVSYLAKEFGFTTPVRYKDIQSLEEAKKNARELNKNREGYVLRYDDGTRWKVKGKEYLYLTRLLQNITPKRIVEALRDGVIEKFMQDIPEEYLDDVREWKREAEYKVRDRLSSLTAVLATVPNTSHREVAAYLKEQYPKDWNLIMALYKGRDIMKYLYTEILGAKDYHVDDSDKGLGVT